MKTEALRIGGPNGAAARLETSNSLYCATS
jgi:hypothetical protein